MEVIYMGRTKSREKSDGFVPVSLSALKDEVKTKAGL